MYQEPNKSPWGAVQTCDTLCHGVFLVSTASHGGTMVSNDVAAILSPAANPVLQQPLEIWHAELPDIMFGTFTPAFIIV